jgi:hypothetical protein
MTKKQHSLLIDLQRLVLCFALFLASMGSSLSQTTLTSSDADNTICESESVTFTVTEAGDNYDKRNERWRNIRIQH